MNETIAHLIKEISNHKKVIAVYLFGSLARGKITPLSDVDVCAITLNANDIERGEIRSFASKKVDIVLFDELPFAIQWRVLSEGKPLYVKNKRFIDNLYSRAFKNYIDFKPIIKRQMEEFLPGVEYA